MDDVVDLATGRASDADVMPMSIPVPPLLNRAPMNALPHAPSIELITSEVVQSTSPPVPSAIVQALLPPPPPLPFPALHLVPLNETFVPKQIALHKTGGRVKIGRQTNAKTLPNGTNGYFDSKVLSRMHAEVWCEDDKVGRDRFYSVFDRV